MNGLYDTCDNEKKKKETWTDPVIQRYLGSPFFFSPSLDQSGHALNTG